MKRVLVQAGHQAPRQPGHLSATGARGEVELVTDIQQALVRRLNRDGRFEGVPVPGRIEEGLKVDAAVFLHADGASSSAATGFSFGFPEVDVNRRLVELIAEEFERIPGHPARRRDNGTVDAARYYGYHLVDTPGPEVLVEHGFVTNPDEHAWLKQNVATLAHAEYRALCRFFGLEPGGDDAGVTVDSVLLHAPRAPRRRPVQHVLARPHGAYSDGSVRSIIGLYYDTATPVGLDPLLAVAQMVLETNALDSFWAQRPRRNPAGIGVTGEPGVGLSFPNWKTAVRAHVGRLLAYALADGQGDDAQRALIAEALSFRPLPPALLGIAPSLSGLAGTWARDPDYATSIARVANDIRGA